MSAVLPNRVPAQPIVEIINDYMIRHGTRSSDGTFEPLPIAVLADQADIVADTLGKILEGRSQTIDFDLADKLLCVMNLPDLWRTRLHDIYEEACFDDDRPRRKGSNPSGIKVCARRGCSEKFIPHPRTPYKRFCSGTCRAAAYKHEHVGVKVMHGKGGKLRALVCKNGHERTKENTRILGGRTYCLVCKREKDRIYQKTKWDRMKANGG